MEAVLTRLKGLTADELREEFARADLKCVAITATTRSIFEKKLAQMLAGPESSTTETDNGSSARDADAVTSVADHDKPLPCAISSVSASSGPNDELDLGYGVGLNPPEEEEISNSQSKLKTPSKAAQLSPAFYYGVCPSWEDILSRNERAHVYTDQKDALQAVKGMKEARFKAFSNREDAENFAKGMCDYFPSPNKSLAPVSPVKPGQIVSKDIMEVDTINRERANSFKSPHTRDLTAELRKAVEKGDEVAFTDIVSSNPRYLIGSGDNPTIVQVGCRYNVMHVAAKENQAGIAQLLLDTLENPEFMRLMYPDDQEDMLQKRIRYIVDLYLNTPDKAGFETPLHFACKFGCPDVVNVLCSHPDTDKNRKSSNDHKPCDIICSRKNTTEEVKQKIRDYLEDRCYIPLLRAADNTSQPVIGAPWSPEASETLSLIQQHAKNPLDPLMTVAAFAGPLSPSKASDFRRSWKTLPRTSEAKHFHNILKSDPDRGAERVGRELAHKMGLPWAEYWDFLDCFVDLSSIKGLQKLEEYLSRKDFFPRTCEEGENETNKFKTPSPGKPKKFCNSISVGAFLDEGEDISLEEMKNRQNAALTSITSSATSMDNLKGAVGGHDFHIMPMGLKYRGGDLIETAAEQDLLSPVVCKNEVCSSSRDGIPNGDKVSPRSSPSASSMLSPVSNLLVEFERMSLQDRPDSPDGCRERRSSSGNRHRETLDSYSSVIGTDQTCGLKRLSIGHGSHNNEALKGGDAEERCSSGSSEEFLDADADSLELMSRTRGTASGVRNLCARSKSWDHGGRDLSSSGSSASSYKSLDNSHEFLPRTPPHIRRGLFIHGDSPTKLDRDVLSAIGDVEVDLQKYPSIHKWVSTMTSYSSSDMQSWPSPGVVKPRLRMQHQTPGSPSGLLVSPLGRFSPARHTASPDFSPSRYSPANMSYIQRIRLKRLNESSI
ncbi:ankyrin repeat and LEM domain-containing protein 2 isoform X1 [Phycodurus eques]|uniref:ankyrin repeat and LEM domain-containing protein 2 isoform X1 n=1 Tax=Phycodurus eques TaxID=693459 RepID=UPI002ACE06D6|nr:ankyrin repeat and LEM domain-containing protein 2 isoform X1 [Phycodurus eques]XP_061528971.1 ankyrin repeat and LEM domain-containing protein 2 isoform X1 [Phycodurus eques]XP_061528972.1 ankyrin repeat and LEM domain-containing protein 2 isoform X1 [Phycodurus eques]XP_061528973.1 ankyrin repeat and LEM domain-containing protein 2 isoform X1 [Phycodurus eques]XP_061528974.1 ankyrin repeat and LEM domain-containing protein 2 isoform X1 [Phycodurus eques]XP_061528975.1 ankyrin repeat and L